MKINANNIRTGMILEHEGRLWRVSKTQHTQPGKGGAYMQVEMKDITVGTKTNTRFRSSEDVEKAEMAQKSMMFMYREGEMLNLMDNDTYEQISVSEELAGDEARWLEDNMMVEVEMHENTPIGIRLPDHVTVTVVQADAAIKGQTANNSFKNAVAENGESLMVPAFVEAGDRIIVNTSDGSYVERA